LTIEKSSQETMEIKETFITYTHEGVGSQFMIEIEVIEDCDYSHTNYADNDNPPKI
jgi:hypothetical protein